MGAQWIVDGSNVVGSRPDGWWRDRPRALARLVDEITRWHDATGDQVVVVADGYPTAVVPEGELYGVEVRYAHSDERDAADDDIVRAVEADSEPGRLTVVTSDRRLRERVDALGAHVEGSRRFLTRIAGIESRRSDRAVLAHFDIDESTLLGRGGEARVFAIDEHRVLRLPHQGVDVALLEQRRRLLAAIAGPEATVALPDVLEHQEVEGRSVVIERRLPGRNAIEVLAEGATDRAALIRHHLDVARRIADLRCPSDRFGELWGEGEGAAPASSFAAWASSCLARSLRVGGDEFAHLDPGALTVDLTDALPEPEPDRPRLVHLDAFLGNMLAEADRITALLDFGPMTIGGPPDLDALVAVAYLAPEITPTATADDRAVAREWARDAGLAAALGPAERWIAAYWTGAPDDHRLRQWCGRILGGRGRTHGPG
jgi:predicted RNA-binding protein with PIN domain